MGVVFSYFWPSESAAERELKLLREENQAAERRTKLQNLLITMASFVSQHSSHSLCPETSLSDKKSGTESVSFSRILELAQVELPDPMQRSKWREMRWKVNLVNYNPTTERVGVHPRLQRILQLLVDGDESPFKLVYEGSFEDRDCIVQRPDFALVLKMMNIERVPLSACVTNLEAKIQGLLSCGTSQSFGYGMLSLLEVVQLVGDAILETDLSIMCFGSDGTDLAVGYIALSHGSLTVHSTGTEKICLWLTKAV